jgi:hypothetical protein
MGAVYFDREGRPVSQEQWRRLSGQPGYCRVGYAASVTGGQEITVATYWLGAIAAGGAGEPVIFHTYAEIRYLAAARPRWRRLWGWATLGQAQSGHRAITAWLPGQATTLAGTGQFPGEPPAAAAG